MGVHAQANCTLSMIPAKTSLLKGHFLFSDGYANVIENVDNSSSNWKNNVHIGANGIQLRYNNVILSEWAAKTITPTGGVSIDPNFTFYYPKEDANTGVVDQGVSALKITTDGLTLYKNDNGAESTREVAQLNSSGLTVKKGGIKGGTPGYNEFIYLSTENYGSVISTLDSNKTNWKLLVGRYFGVDSDGYLYASNANITGVIKANTGYIGGPSGWTIESQKLYSTGKSLGANGSMYLATTNLGSNTSIAGRSGSDWRLTIGSNFGVTENGILYANGGSFNGRIEATEGYFSSSVTIGSGGTALSTIEANAKQSQVYNIGVNNGTTGYHFLGTLTLSGQTAEAEIEIHTGAGQNNEARQNLTIRVNIKIGYQATTAATAGITVRYEGDPNIITMGESNCSIIARCTEVGVLNIYMYTPNWGYADGWYQVKGRNWSWIHSGTLVTTAPSEGTAQTVSTMNAYTTATNYITNIGSDGIYISPANQSPTASATGNSVKINSTGMDIYKGGISVAEYGDTARIGKVENNTVRTVIAGTSTAGGMDVIYRNGSGTDTTMAHIGYASGAAQSGTAIAPYYSLGTRRAGSAIGNYSVAEGLNNAATAYCAHAEGYNTYATGLYGSHAEGYICQATGTSAHAEGNDTLASGIDSHAEGESTVASGQRSHAGGIGTIAAGDSQTAIGKYNVSDTSSLFIIGNGTSDSARSNALKVDGSGNITAGGALVPTRKQICYANSRVDTFSSGSITLSLATLGITTGAKPVGILLTPEYSSGVIMKYDYDGSSASGVKIYAYTANGSAYSGALRYFAVVFQNSWTSIT